MIIILEAEEAINILQGVRLGYKLLDTGLSTHDEKLLQIGLKEAIHRNTNSSPLELPLELLLLYFSRRGNCPLRTIQGLFPYDGERRLPLFFTIPDIDRTLIVPAVLVDPPVYANPFPVSIFLYFLIVFLLLPQSH